MERSSPWLWENCAVSGLNVDFSSTQKSLIWNGFFVSTGLKGMPQRNYKSSLETAFPFISAFINQAFGCIDNAELITIHTLCSVHVNNLLCPETVPDTKPSGESTARVGTKKPKNLKLFHSSFLKTQKSSICLQWSSIYSIVLHRM